MLIKIGYCFDTPSGPVDHAEKAARDLVALIGGTERDVARTPVVQLAGPNDTFQLIVEAPDWIKFGLAIYGAELLKEAAKATWRQHDKISEAARKAISGIAQAFVYMCYRKGATATISVPIDEQNTAGIAVSSTDIGEAERLLALMCIHAPAIQSHISHLLDIRKVDSATGITTIQFNYNPDLRTIELTPNSNGALTMNWKENGQEKSIEFPIDSIPNL